MKFYKNIWFWGLLFFVALSVSWGSYASLAKNKMTNQVDEKPKISELQTEQVTQSNMLPDTRLLINEELENTNPSPSQSTDKNPDNNQSESNIVEKLNKVKTLQELQNQKNFMLSIAQDDLEHYTWGEKSQFKDIWRQAYLRFNLNGGQVMFALQHDIDTYLAYGNGNYALVWAEADLFYEADKTGKLKDSMTPQDYKALKDKLSAVKSRLGIIYAKREYITPLYSQEQPQQAPY